MSMCSNYLLAMSDSTSTPLPRLLSSLPLLSPATSLAQLIFDETLEARKKKKKKLNVLL